MKGCHLRFGFLETSVLFCLLIADPTAAQIVPDATLPNNSTVNLQGSRSVIEGGTTAGGNLFHSFREFSVPTGGSAFFNNTGDIQNIFSRVTGNSISNIDGLIRANGVANLFLLNPNGIIFGPNARLNIGGSFFASTASSFKFADGVEFSATNPQAPPLLTINVPIGLQFGANPGSIINRSRLTDRNNVRLGLQVPLGQTIALVGGDVLLEGGSLTAPEGRIELGSVADSGLVSLIPTDQGLTLDYQSVSTFRDIQLSEGASATANGEGGGNIQVQSRRLTMTDGSQIGAATLGAKPGGIVKVRTTESVELTGTLPDGQTATNLGTTTLGTGDGGDVTIQTGRLILRNGAGAGSATALGQGNAGNVTVNASESVELIGSSPNGQSQSVLGAATVGSTGNAGNVMIQTRQLTIRDGAGVIAGTFLGKGNGGTITVNASELVELIGTSPDGQNSSVLGVGTFGGTGNAGNVMIQTGQLIVRDGARILASTIASEGNAGNVTVKAKGSLELIGANSQIITSTSGIRDAAGKVTISGIGNAGDVTLETARLIIRDGAGIQATTSGSDGNAGNVNMNASESVEIIGTSPDGSKAGVIAFSNSGGDAGNLTIQTRRLILRDGAFITASTNFGSSQAGNVTVIASELVELSGTSPDGSTTGMAVVSLGGGNAGNVTVQTGRLILRDGASIGAGALFGSGKAGNVTVNASESVELSGISPQFQQPSNLGAATANAGDAGNVTITTGQLIIRDGAEINVRSQKISTIIGNLDSFRDTVRDTLNMSIEEIEAVLNFFFTLEALNPSLGKPGNINITAGDMRLDNKGSVNASSETGQGGNIQVRSRNIQLRNQSQINAAGSPNLPTTEGSIDIQTQSLVLLEGSSIITSSSDPRGGSNIAIAPRNDLGLAVFQSSDSIINARGELNIEGDIQPDPPDIPQIEVVDATQLIAPDCPIGTRLAANEFFITGRGGIPPTPREALANNALDVGWVTPNSQAQEGRGAGEQRSRGAGEPHTEIVEATGWVRGANGEVILIANQPTLTPYGTWYRSILCPVPQPNN